MLIISVLCELSTTKTGYNFRDGKLNIQIVINYINDYIYLNNQRKTCNFLYDVRSEHLKWN